MLEVRELRKSYGDREVLKGVSFSAGPGEIISFLGSNGSGKTTTFLIMLGLLEKDGGSVLYNRRVPPGKLTGFLPEERSMYHDCSVERQLRLFGRLKGMKDSQINARMDYWISVTGMEQYLNVSPAALSKGNQQKIQLIITLLHDPKLIIMDEPWTGLDKDNMTMFSRIIQKEKLKRKIIILSSHQHQEVQNICDRFLHLQDGVIDADITSDELGRLTQRVVVTERRGDLLMPDDSVIMTLTEGNKQLYVVSDEEKGWELMEKFHKKGISDLTIRALQIGEYLEVKNGTADKIYPGKTVSQ